MMRTTPDTETKTTHRTKRHPTGPPALTLLRKDAGNGTRATPPAAAALQPPAPAEEDGQNWYAWWQRYGERLD